MNPGTGATMKKYAMVVGLVFLVSAVMLVAMSASRRAGWIGGGLTGGGAAGAGVGALVPDPLVAGMRIPEFALTTQEGKALTRADLLGKITIADFMFTHCPFICPLLTAKMNEMCTKLGQEPQAAEFVRFLSFSVDPAHDTPARLTEYAKERELDTSRWTFATGEFEVVKRIATDELKFALETDTRTPPFALPDGTTMSNIVHPQHFVLIGPEAEVLGIFAAKDDAQVAELMRRAKAAAAELARRRK